MLICSMAFQGPKALPGGFSFRPESEGVQLQLFLHIAPINILFISLENREMMDAKAGNLSTRLANGWTADTEHEALLTTDLSG